MDGSFRDSHARTRSYSEKAWASSTNDSSAHGKGSKSQFMTQMSQFSGRLASEISMLTSTTKPRRRSPESFAAWDDTRSLKADSSSVEEGRRGAVLIVDDDGSIRKLAERMLSRQGFEVHTAENGQVGLEALKTYQYRVVVIDSNMPVMDGVECVRSFRRWENGALAANIRGQKQVIFMCTGSNPEAEFVKEALVDIFISKPMKIKALIQDIENYA